MLVDLLKKGIISKEKLIFDNYNKIGLTENQVMVVLMIMYMSRDQNKFITPTVLSKKMHLTDVEIENEIEDMIEKNLVKISGKNIDFSLLFNKLALTLEEEYLTVEDQTFIEEIQSQLNFQMNPLQAKELANMINVNISKNQLIEVVTSEETIDTYSELVKKIAKVLSNKPKGITKFNWLDN